MQGEVINRGQEQRVNKKRLKKRRFYLIWWQIAHKNFIFAGPDTGRTLLVRPVHTSVKQKIPQKWGIFYLIWWPWSDSNRHSLQNLILSQARLPIPPRGQKGTGSNLFHQARTAICLVHWFFGWFFNFAQFFINRFFNRGHFRR